jgi:hypothetical protein
MQDATLAFILSERWQERFSMKINKNFTLAFGMGKGKNKRNLLCLPEREKYWKKC